MMKKRELGKIFNMAKLAVTINNNKIFQMIKQIKMREKMKCITNEYSIKKLTIFSERLATLVLKFEIHNWVLLDAYLK